MNYTRLIFHHVPKSGGTSVIQSLRRTNGEISHKRIPFVNPDVFKRGNTSRNCWSSHFAFDPIEFKPTKAEFYFTVIRHPLAVIESGLKYYRKTSKPHESFRPADVRKSISDMLSHRKFENVIHACSQNLWTPLFPNYYYEGIKGNEQKFHFIGICEDMELTTKKLSEAIGVRLRPRHSNATKHERREFPRDYPVPSALKQSTEFYWECRDRLQSTS